MPCRERWARTSASCSIASWRPPKAAIPIVADLSREIRFHYFDRPVIEAATEAAYRKAEEQLAELAADPEAGGRADLIGELVDCPRPLAPMLSERLRTAEPPLRRVLLEVMTRRYYRRHALAGFEQHELDGVSLLTATHPEDGSRRRVVSAYVDAGRPAGGGRVARPLRRVRAEDEQLVADFYADYEGEPPEQTEWRSGSGRCSARTSCRQTSTGWSSRSRSRRAGAGCPPSTSSPSGGPTVRHGGG